MVQRQRLRDSLQRVSERQSRPPPIYRRTYYVPGPNALWHLDGNHKLIRWKLVAIDGFSRLITFLQCSSNNLSETMLDCFIGGVHEYGLPSRIRTDHGGENILVWEFMEQQRGPDRSSYIAGSSVHNSRIERLWRDMYRAVSSTYATLFTELECDGALCTDNEADLFALHYIFIPKINRSLSIFKSAWNNHSLSSENNMSPLQLYTAYAIGSSLFDHDIDPLVYGIEPPEEDQDQEESDNAVVVPKVHIPLTLASLQQLQTINPMEDCSDNGKQLYLNAIQLLYTLMLNDNLLD